MNKKLISSIVRKLRKCSTLELIAIEKAIVKLTGGECAEDDLKDKIIELLYTADEKALKVIYCILEKR